jgi:hypothetical protein
MSGTIAYLTVISILTLILLRIHQRQCRRQPQPRDVRGIDIFDLDFDAEFDEIIRRNFLADAYEEGGDL